MTNPTPSDVVASQIRKFRKDRGWSAQKLATRCAELGSPEITDAVIANVETGRRNASGQRRRGVTVDELLTLAYALDVAPVHLLVPTDDERTLYHVTPAAPPVRPDLVRDFIRGRYAPGDVDVRRYASQVPPHEFGAVRDGKIDMVQFDALMAKHMEERGIETRVQRDDATGAATVSYVKPEREDDGS